LHRCYSRSTVYEATQKRSIRNRRFGKWFCAGRYSNSGCRVAASKTPTPRLFRNLQPSVKPEATKSRRFNADDQAFIKHEIDHLLKNDIIEPFSSPWRAQVPIVNNASGNRLLASIKN